jgi:putative chitinase
LTTILVRATVVFPQKEGGAENMLDRAKLYAGVRNGPFPGILTTSQVQGMDVILNAWDTSKLTDLRWLAYMLATTFHETARTMQPIEEFGKGKGKAYGKPTGPFHQVYDGRGDVQLTWERNYASATTRLRKMNVLTKQEDLEETPALAMRPDVAAAVLIYGMTEGWFTGKKLSKFFTDNTTNWVDARTIINGHDRADVIAGYAKQFYTDILAASDTAAKAA